VVVPTCRPDSYKDFVEAWTPLFTRYGVDLIPVFDDEKGWQGIPDFIPRRTDMIRSWGIYKAWQSGSDYTLTLDDDVRPHGDIFAAYESVFDSGAPVSPYLDVGALTTFDGQLRGFPFKDREKREVAVQYGGWHGVLDYDAPTQLEGVNDQEWFESIILPVPKGSAVTGCIMNACWRTKYAPMMWQLPMLDGKFNRFGDIWAGLFAKKTCDALGLAMVVNGAASVRHERASNPETNMEREKPGIPVNESLWEALWSENGTLDHAYRLTTDFAFSYFHGLDEEYAEHFVKSRDAWLRLFADR
jgi:hypothetical protein